MASAVRSRLEPAISFTLSSAVARTVPQFSAIQALIAASSRLLRLRMVGAVRSPLGMPPLLSDASRMLSRRRPGGQRVQGVAFLGGAQRRVDVEDHLRRLRVVVRRQPADRGPAHVGVAQQRLQDRRQFARPSRPAACRARLAAWRDRPWRRREAFAQFRTARPRRRRPSPARRPAGGRRRRRSCSARHTSPPSSPASESSACRPGRR